MDGEESNMAKKTDENPNELELETLLDENP